MHFAVSERKIIRHWKPTNVAFQQETCYVPFQERIKTVREIVTYIRVSTEGQHKSGLGEDAQRRALAEFASQHGLRIAAEYSDTASGAAPLTKRRGSPRPSSTPASASARWSSPGSTGCRATFISSGA